MIKWIFVILSLTATLSLIPLTQAADWPFYRGPNYNGVSAETDWNPTFPATGPNIAWKKDLGIGASSFTIVGNSVLTMGNINDEDILWCLNAEDGSVIWEYRYPCKFEARMFDGGTASTPTVHNGLVYALSYDGQLHAVDLQTGKKVWSTHLLDQLDGKLSRWKYSGSPLIVNGKLFLDAGGKNSSTVALDPATGKAIWRAGDEKAGYASIIPFEQSGKPALLVFKGESMLGVDQENGQELWRIPWRTSYDVNASSPINLGDHVLISSGYRDGRAVLYDITGSQPKQLWRNNDVKTKMSSCVVLDDHFYAVTEAAGKLLCVNLKSGNTVWEERGTGQFGTIIAAGNTLIVLSDGGELWTVKASPKRFELIAKGKILDKTCWVTPAMAHGRIYCRNNKGNMVCIDVRN